MPKLESKFQLLKERWEVETDINEGVAWELGLEVMDFLKEKPNPSDDIVHKWAEEKGYDIHLIEKMLYKFATKFMQIMTEGKSNEEGVTENDFDREQILKGIKVELEHTKCPKIAEKIVLDHLVESPVYYDYLEEMEKAIEANVAAEDVKFDGSNYEFSESINESTEFECLECGAKFKKNLKSGQFEVKCPKCGGYDTDLASPSDIGRVDILKKGTKVKLKSGKVWTLPTNIPSDKDYLYFTVKGKVMKAKYTKV